MAGNFTVVVQCHHFIIALLSDAADFSQWAKAYPSMQYKFPIYHWDNTSEVLTETKTLGIQALLV